MKFCDLKDLHINTIKGVQWAEDLWNYLSVNIQKSYLNWVEHVMELSSDSHIYNEWVDIYKKEFERCAGELLGDMEHLHAKALSDVEELLSKLQRICRELRMEIPVIGENNHSLYEEKKLLTNKVEEFESLWNKRKEELAQLQSKELALCDKLGQNPKIFPGSLLPKPEQMLDLRAHVEHLERETFEREEKYFKTKDEILKLMEELKLRPSGSFEREVVDGDDSKFRVTNNNMKQLDNFYKKLVNCKEHMLDDINGSWNKINKLWSIMDVDVEQRKTFVDNNKEKSVEVLDALKVEIKRLEAIRMENIKVLIKKYKTELFLLLNKCHKEKIEFTCLNEDFYTDELIEQFELELQIWKRYYEDNKVLLKRIEDYKHLWAEVGELEKSTDSPNRYKNRGGTLLQEERERNKLQKKITLLESELREKATSFFERTGKTFYTWGQTIDEMIMAIHNQQENERKERLSARKMSRDKSVGTPGRSPRQLSSTSLLPALTQLTPENASKCKLTKASSETKKKSRVNTKTASPSVKRGPKKVVSSRISLGKEIRRKRSTEDKENKDNQNDYEQFQLELSQRKNARSTLNSNTMDFTLSAKNLFVEQKVPSIVVTPDTPQTFQKRPNCKPQ